MKIEFEDELDKLTFEEEHLLGRKPMQIDELIIKLKSDTVIEKNIGRIFRKYNIVEYKSPEDYLCINDFYKVYGYTCFYQSETEHVCEIDPQELTITFAANKYPRKMIRHLEQVRGYTVEKQEAGIYYIKGDPIPMQLIVVRELDQTENCWLQSLRNDIQTSQEFERLIQKYEKHKHSELYQAVMNVVMRANRTTIEEVKPIMCEALRELMAEEFEENTKKVTKEVTKEVTRELAARLKKNGVAISVIADTTGLSKEEVLRL